MTDTATAPLPVAAGAAPAHAGPAHGAPAHGGAARHWGLERATSVAALVLIVWLLVSLWRLPALDFVTISEWLKNPIAAVPMLLLIVTIFWHLKMGLIVVVEDYVHEEGSRFFWLLLINFAAILVGTLAIFSLLKIAFTVAGPGTP
jgi:succinate dehydrogenase / fumarate reductase membrane anchor subunit